MSFLRWGLLGGAQLLCWVALTLAAAPAGADEAEWLFDPARVVEIDLEMTPEAQAALEAEPDEYVPATFSLSAAGQSYGPYEVGARLKGGHGSFRELSEKAAFKVKFDEYVDDQTFFGLERLTLNNMVQDPSMVHEVLTYGLFDALGVPASRTGYAFVRINDEEYGVYLNIETLDKISLPRWFASTQHLYEADAPGLDVSPGQAGKFEVDRGDDEDLTDLEALIAAANDTEGDWSDGMAGVADLDEMTRMWAVERYVGHWDGYAGVAAPFRPNNYYLHSLDSGVFEMMPWGTDQTWVLPVEFGEPAGGLLFNNCLADPACEALYEEALGEVRSVVPAMDLDARAICTAELLAPWQALEDPQRREYDAAEIEEGVADVRAFIARRPAELAEWLGTEAPDVPGGTGSCPEAEPPPSPPPTSGPSVTTPSSSALAVAARLRLRRVEIDGRWLKAHVAAPGAGRLKLVARTPGHGSPILCSGVKEVATAGPALLGCRLPRVAQRKLAERALRLGLRVSFRSAAGPIDSVFRTVTLPRR